MIIVNKIRKKAGWRTQVVAEDVEVEDDRGRGIKRVGSQMLQVTRVEGEDRL